MKASSLFLAPNSINSSKICLPGSKSISNRSLLLAALSQGKCHLYNVLDSDDTQYMKKALESLGIDIQNINQNEIMIEGNEGNFTVKEADLFLGNAGTAFRPLTSVLALQDGHYHMHGVPRMHERPIKDLVDSLQQIGSHIEYLEQPGCPPLMIEPFAYNGKNTVSISGLVSSQFLTALLIALPLLKKEITIEVTGDLISKPYINITLNMIKKFGITIVNHHFKSFTIPANSKYVAPEDYYIESDASSASYFLAAAFLTGVPLTLEGLGQNSIQGDIEFAYELEKLGAHLEMTEQSITLSRDNSLPIPAFNIDAIHIPDAAMTFCIIALAANGTSTIRNIASWRVKETDRIEAMKTELEKLGATIETTQDSIKITPPLTLNPNVDIDTYDDHRMAMCFALVSLLNTPITINDPECVKKTFPDFFKVFTSLYAE
ncbi:3-phosphoshikimate 1-carboxyvinyltransferase [Neisseriaceae bacterium PsAf]|nr:3-phosphoshikimate 1-carboxyvinyltransferase [Neisseriaceae bacterium PsAf]MCV2503300.1 3-phosphoshikimate 1-carboxyvinyltransferase [Neisseriaceae bacterium]